MMGFKGGCASGALPDFCLCSCDTPICNSYFLLASTCVCFLFSVFAIRGLD